jgi:hypothetical protein
MPHLPVMEMAGFDRQGHAGLQNRIVTFLEVGAFRDIEPDVRNGGLLEDRKRNLELVVMQM